MKRQQNWLILNLNDNQRFKNFNYDKKFTYEKDKTNYLLNLVVYSAYFDLKSISLIENSKPNFFQGQNQIRMTGRTLQMYKQERFT
ncbi:unnamed protein product [Paramecium sonneborni]|uniref:Pre-mRNA-splicing factor SLU7 domain-containing protein n=1 Tax=Paramecium sonneborni TaxID=65129 RepID=A0A8S1KBR4_9CILI|nr:unnamed protein product [Paramecium sonneborni]